MASSGAPMRYLATNLGALAIGLTMLLLLGRTGETGRQWTNGASILIAGTLLATALLGVEVDGAARWVNFAGFALQPSLIFLPVLLVAFSRTRSLLATVSLIVAVTAMAVQPDRAMAGMIAVSLAVLALLCRDRASVVALTASFIGFAVTLMRSDMLPASPYVDQILYSSFEVHPAAGLAVLLGSVLLLIPAFVGWSRDVVHRTTYAVFGAAWFAAIAAAALGNYPTPIVGYGGSAIIGYVLSLLALPKFTGEQAKDVSRSSGQRDQQEADRHLLVQTA
jgi:hypothetical protein